MKYPSENKSESKTLTDGSACHATSAQSSPRVVIRGESIDTPPPSLNRKIAFTDYLSFTHRPEDMEFDSIPLKEILTNTFGIPPYGWKQTDRGWNGYKYRVDLDGLGLVAWGGESQKNTIHVQISGRGCAMVPDWLDVVLWGTQTQTKITRVDFAHDDLLGEYLNISIAKEWLEAGLFNSSGRPPKPAMYDDFDTGDGKTLKIGNRKNGKMLRIYEKGKQLGDPSSPWCRAEVEYRNKDRKIGWDSLLVPADYLAGSYKALEFLSCTQTKIKTLKKAQSIILERYVKYCSNGYGKFINFLANEQGLEPQEIIDMLSRDGIPKSLKHYVS